ncbi:hypothetical protein A1O3_01020 [Capronia epimyces CBS 606.96]|uniref:Uncharacterized protein n=1 Tax=Capronia epimyces CBS 606.96 TaxID=1182542 RepID=W9ZD78_9EURO|nr:uncharacterized protein A1O3_01020 [Capronia epimyces CBS 606.96]EXJ92469.1 hypothetical protein A1O3_01020 [Capronia epimyces CBS 606.96]
MAYSQNIFAASRSTPSLSVPPSQPASDAVLHPPHRPLKKPTEAPYTFLCTIYWTEHEPPPQTLGLESRIVCADCWKWLHSISICWYCGELVFRQTDASPLRPPPYFNERGLPHKRGITVDEAPVCPSCSAEPQSLTKLEQHARKPRSQSAWVKPPAGLLDRSGSRVSLDDPLNPEANKIGIQRHAPGSLPPWMSLLPSVRRAREQSAHHEASRRRATFPRLEKLRPPTPFATPPQYPARSGQTGAPLEVPSALSLRHSQESTESFVSSLSRPLSQGTIHTLHRSESLSYTPPYSSVTSSQINEQFNQTPSRESLQSRSHEPIEGQTLSKLLLRRNPSIQRHSHSLCRASTTSTIAPGTPGTSRGSRGWSPLQARMPCQDIPRPRAPSFKELSDFFATGAATGKWSPAASSSASQMNASGASTPSRLRKACHYCGMDMSNWWLQRASDSGVRRRATGAEGPCLGTPKICPSCKAGNGIPGAWT